MRTGRDECGRDGGCNAVEEESAIEPLPDVTLDPYSAFVFRFFSETALALWTSGFGIAHVPRGELAEEARARNFELSDFLLSKYAICERAFRDALKSRENDE